MSRPVASETSHAPSPDPSSHARTIYDDPAGEADWFDGEDDDDMDCELSIEESEDNEFFDPSEEAEAEADFFGLCHLVFNILRLAFQLILALSMNC